jgi:uncharacterized protein with PIN domain
MDSRSTKAQFTRSAGVAPTHQHLAEFRFYEELNDFLPSARRKHAFTHTFHGTPTVKDTIEALGVPHTEVDLILVNGKSVRFSFHLHGDERIAVYPMFERFDLRPVYRLRPRPLRRTRFVADVHLGTLARRLRLLGFDTIYDPAFDDVQLAAVSARERRVLLTRDIGLLKRSVVTHGHWVRHTEPLEQLKEIVEACSLQKDLRPFTRCMICNGKLQSVDRHAIVDLVPLRVYAQRRRFTQCAHCKRIYWRGTHYKHLSTLAIALRRTN